MLIIPLQYLIILPYQFFKLLLKCHIYSLSLQLLRCVPIFLNIFTSITILIFLLHHVLFYFFYYYSFTNIFLILLKIKKLYTVLNHNLLS